MVGLEQKIPDQGVQLNSVDNFRSTRSWDKTPSRIYLTPENVAAHSLQLIFANFSAFVRTSLWSGRLCDDFQLSRWYGIYIYISIYSIFTKRTLHHHHHQPIQSHKSPSPTTLPPPSKNAFPHHNRLPRSHRSSNPPIHPRSLLHRLPNHALQHRRLRRPTRRPWLRTLQSHKRLHNDLLRDWRCYDRGCRGREPKWCRDQFALVSFVLLYNGIMVLADHFPTNSVDIAIAVGHILDQCTHEVAPYGMKASGEEKANRNGDIVVHAVLKQ